MPDINLDPKKNKGEEKGKKLRAPFKVQFIGSDTIQTITIKNKEYNRFDIIDTSVLQGVTKTHMGTNDTVRGKFVQKADGEQYLMAYM